MLPSQILARSLHARLAAGAAALALLAAPLPAAAGAPGPAAAIDTGKSPASCAAGDLREPGLQGEVPAGQKAGYNCGLKMLASLPVAGSVAGTGSCAYVRSWGNQQDSKITVIDVSDPKKPVIVGEPLPAHMNSESLRVVVTPQRAVMVSGSSVFDVSDCRHPKLLGEIKWPDTTVPGVARKNLPHDIRVNREGTKVYASFGLWEVDLGNLADPASWKITDHRCTIAAQVPGPWQDLHRAANKAGRSLCDDATRRAPMGANYAMGGSPLQASLLWPQFSHSIDFNADDTRLYTGDQAGGTSALWAPRPKVRIVDLTQKLPKIIGEVDGPGHGLDWFRSGGREYVLHSNEGGTAGIMGQPQRGDPCKPWPHTTELGWAFEAFISEVTDPAKAHGVSMLQIAINKPENCAARKASGRDPWLAYHLIDNPMDAKFAALNFGDAGMRVFDIRDPEHPVEVAYFNHGSPTHASFAHYDTARGLLYYSDAEGFKVLQIEPQVRKRLKL